MSAADFKTTITMGMDDAAVRLQAAEPGVLGRDYQGLLDLLELEPVCTFHGRDVIDVRYLPARVRPDIEVGTPWRALSAGA